jgi:hypothetical protein
MTPATPKELADTGDRESCLEEVCEDTVRLLLMEIG